MTLIKNSFPLTPLSRLRHGHDEGAPAGVCNVRIAGRENGLDELAASIASVGLLQPLVVVRHEGLSYVADGNRRLAALMRLAAAGTISTEHEIDVVERDAATAREAGLAANLTQSTMHEADQMLGFAELAAGGLKPKEIAGRFGVSVPHVKKLLALGSVAPCILDAWRAGKHGVNIETVKSFTLAPSVAEQERVYGKLAKEGGSMYCHQIREELGAGHSTATMLKRVGLDAFKAAGGHVIKDLFGDQSAVSDPALLKRLADERLIARRDELRADGWVWVELESDLPFEARYSWSTLHAERREPTAAEAARLREIEAIVEADDDGSVSDEMVQALTDEHRTIEASLMGKPGPEDRARTGCVVSWNWDGEISVKEYVLRPEDAKPVPANAGPAPDVAPAEPEAKGLSSALLDRLSTQMTEAVRDALDTAPRAALAGLLAGATCKNPWSAPVRLRLEGLGHENARVADNETFEVLFNRYLSMSDEDLFASLGRVLARGVDLRSRTPGAGTNAGAPANSPAIQGLAGAIDADTLAARLAERFDAQDFFSSAPKAVTLAAIAEACGAEASARAGKLKKAEIVAIALAEVVPTGWLPREIRWPGYAGPGAEQALAEAA
ncbi:ParB/RepB/Spo0J family partition protein [Methylobacterium komagatae]|uniref:ParB/RepB/Spo0J family partition protein n=1 Tax=Methylobacterium komagatae TaxID=374425 RepID=A0ABW2BMM2_9HYPH